ncbi:MAG: extracellular solute-binding protein [Defluviitaleaceae bacterium]|nr:extracellular solute-binding protein [Defluviitaleaceae bacterium]
MKKTIFTLLAVVAMFALAACGGDDTPATPTPPAPGGAAETAPATTGDAATETADNGDNGGEELTETQRLIAEHFPGTDLGGIVVRTNGFDNPEHENPVVAAQAAAARDYVEAKFNVTLEFDVLAGLDWNAVPDIVTASVAAGDPIVHIFGSANAGYWVPAMGNQGILVEGGQWIRDNFPRSWWEYTGEHMGRTYGFMTGPNYSWGILAFNTQLIMQAGMDRTPQEMFMDGEWHLDDFYAYLAQLRTLLPPEVYVIAMHPNNWQRGAAYANGGYFKNPRTHAPGYLDEAFLQPARTFQALVQNGIHMPSVFLTEEDVGIPGGLWSFGAAMGNPMGEFEAGNMAMAFANTWNFGAISANFEFGVVPFPWGDNVTFPASGDWREIFDHPNFNSFSNDASTTVLIQGLPSAITHEVAANMIFSFYDYRGIRLIEARELLAQGLPEVTIPGGFNDLWTDLDREIFQLHASNPIWEPLDSVGTPLAFTVAWQNALGSGADISTALSAIIGEDVWAMFNAGTIDLADVPESVRIQAEEFGVAFAAAQEAAAAEEDEEDEDE